MANDRDDDRTMKNHLHNPYGATLKEEKEDPDFENKMKELAIKAQVTIPEYKGIQKLPTKSTDDKESALSKSDK